MSKVNWIKNIEHLFTEDQLKKFPENITGIAFDSRLVKPGNIFVCYQGRNINSNEFIDDAIKKGAILIISDDQLQLQIHRDVAVFYIENTRNALSFLSDAFYNSPSKDLYTIGITGTDGKSTTAFLIYSILKKLDFNVSLISTLGVYINGQEVSMDEDKTRLTTPDPPDLFYLIQTAQKAGSTHIILEMTSHALNLDKVNPIKLDCAIFTSFSPDHQEFHDTEDDYFTSKSKIINLLKPNGHLILNADNLKLSALSKQAGSSITVGFNPNADVSMKKMKESLFNVDYLLKTDEGDFSGSTQLMGDFNLMNIAMAYVSALKSGAVQSKIIDAIKDCDNVPGRFERINGAPFHVIVDYAHTPDAFEKILNTLSSYITKRLIVVFGCAGERSKERRIGLGKLTAEKTDMSIITEEDSRSESIHDIVQDIENEMKKAGSTTGNDYEIILDRREAIKFSLQYAEKDDFVLILGKGHEKSIELNGEFIPWDDRKITNELINIIYN